MKELKMAKNVKQANVTRAQKAKALHAEKTAERKADAQSTKANYLAAKDGPIVQDLLEKGRMFLAYHQKIAQDGVGARKTGHLLENGQAEVENYFLDHNERVSHLDKAAGIQELIDYIERQITPPAPDTKPKSKQTE